MSPYRPTSPTLRSGAADVAELVTVESEYQAAVAVEAADTTLHNAGGQTALSPLLELRSRVRVGEYVAAALENRGLVGAAAEYNAELGYNDGGAHLPWELVAPDVEQRTVTIDGLEYRQDVATAPGVTNRRPGGRFLDRVMAGTHADYLGITFDSVAVGEPLHTVMTAGTTAAMREPGGGD